MSTSVVDIHYQDLCRRILYSGDLRRNKRTGVDCYTLFGERLVIDLTQGFPLLTTRKIYWKGIIRELLWFISGSVDVKKLQEQNVHIWDGNSSRDFLDKRGLTEYPEGNIGPSYGWQWRNFGSLAKDVTTPPQDRGGVDQLQNVIDKINEDPTDRRLIVSAWNPVDLPRIALPPCHILYQFFVRSNNTLSCQLYQRSCDVALGLPFNIASYALLTHIVASICGLKVSKLIICLGDTHIYANHQEGIMEQIQRAPKELPTLKLHGKLNLNSITEDQIELIGYNPHPQIGGLVMVI